MINEKNRTASGNGKIGGVIETFWLSLFPKTTGCYLLSTAA